MNKIILFLIFLLGNILHILFLNFNKILKVADSFAYLQMAHGIKYFSLDGFGTGWFGFLYSFPIACVDLIVNNDMISSFIVNILLFNLIAILCYFLGKKYLDLKYNILFVGLVFLSPILLNYNINILSENIYIPLFLILFLGILNLRGNSYWANGTFLGFILALLYYTRSEAFIYIGSVGLIFVFLMIFRQIKLKTFILNSIILIISFFFFISPYLYFLHTITGEWGLTNKGSANIRQAELRGVSKMDDNGFERAVGELTPNNHKLIAGFAGGLKYDASEKSESFKGYLLKNPSKVIERIGENQTKLYTSNLPNLTIGNAFKLYSIEGSRLFYENKIFLSVILVPILLMIFGIVMMIKNKNYYFVFSFFSFFLTASLFFTLFFVLDRYFVIFVPIFIFFIVYGCQSLYIGKRVWIEWTKYLILAGILSGIYSLGTFSYYNTIKGEDAKYEVKKIAGEWLYNYHGGNLTRKTEIKIMERFPIVTYYSGTKERWLTPYTDKIENLVEYARYNKLDYLVVDSLDFYTYRPGLLDLYQKRDLKYDGLVKVKEFEKNGEKVILYRVR